ncbi:unnamed protein product [Blepharisma stoltei]|uniref:Ubiquitin-like domain-containing protein n=1 Tax=Blepharisma stoltei TaxID=1481888 RepID=A0AAU9IVH1_9CILI|nr:unnamed protein product [Blepharisma stoltei]
MINQRRTTNLQSIEVLSIDDLFHIESDEIPDNGIVEDLAKIIETKKSIDSMDLTLYTNGRRLNRAEKIKSIKWEGGLQFILHPDVPTWCIHFKVNSIKKAGHISFPYPEKNTIFDLLQKLNERLSLNDIPNFRELEFQSYGKLNVDAQLQTIENNSMIKIKLKFEKNVYDQSKYVLVNIRIDGEEGFSLYIKYSSKVSELKWLLACRGKKVLRLILQNGVVLDDDKTIMCYPIQNRACIEGHKGALGGVSGLGFTFADITEQKQLVLRFDENAPRWRTVKRGISFKAHCRNSYCEAGSRGDWVIVNKGFGVFSFGETITSLKCPACGKRVSRAENCGFFDCKWRFRGEKEDENEGLQECGDRVAMNDAYYTFAESNERWIYLKVEAREKDREFQMRKKNNCN